MATWFSAGAVLPHLQKKWGISAAQGSLLTIAVNLGFMAGTLGSLILRLPEHYRPTKLMATGSALAAAFNSLLVVPGCSFEAAVVARVLTGMSMSLVYPQACNLASTWFVARRGMAMGVIIAGVVLGSSGPHLIRGGFPVAWQQLVMACSALSLVSSVVDGAILTEGPAYRGVAAPTSDKPSEEGKEEVQVGLISTASKLLGENQGFRYATLAYAGHNWELYALWNWYAAFAADKELGFGMADRERGAALVAFAVVASGSLGAFGAGLLADQIGRTTVCLFSLGVSVLGSGCSGWIEAPGPLTALGIIWGVFAIADSAQYSTMVSELVPAEQCGTAITLQFGLGFLFTVPGLYIVPAIGVWDYAWLALAPGTLLAMIAVWQLRRDEAAAAAGQRLGRAAF